MRLDEALGSISEIRAQICHTETFRGYRSLTVGFSGLLGLVAAAIQAQRIPNPTQNAWAFIDLWTIVAGISLIVVGVELGYHCAIADSPLRRRLTILAVQQFAPCLIAGAAVTLVVAISAQETAWLLPGLWAVIFSLGVFASCRLLPKPIFWVGVHYLATGSLCLSYGRDELALSPWLMVVTFGVGQILAAAILYYSLERREASHEE